MAVLISDTIENIPALSTFELFFTRPISISNIRRGLQLLRLSLQRRLSPATDWSHLQRVKAGASSSGQWTNDSGQIVHCHLSIVR